MSPAVLAGQRLRRLAATLRRHLEALERHREVASRLMDGWAAHRSDPAWHAWAATTLHAWYTGLETALERSLRAVDGEVPTGAAAHRALLEQASLELPGLRPAVVETNHLPALRELLAFRHFFRNAYPVELDPARLDTNLRLLLAVAPGVQGRLGAAASWLEAAAEDAGR